MPVKLTVDGKRVFCRRMRVGWRKGNRTGTTSKVFCRKPKKRKQ